MRGRARRLVAALGGLGLAVAVAVPVAGGDSATAGDATDPANAVGEPDPAAEANAAGKAVVPAPLPAGDEIARRVNARDEGAAVSRTLVMELRDAGGKTRRRVTRSFRARIGGERRSVIFFEEPTNLKGTAFLTWDRSDAGEEDALWLYLPALRKSRRIATGDRGRSFLGTDFSYEDVKKESRVVVEDWTWRTLGQAEVDGHACYRVEALPVDARTASELGYGKMELWVDQALWLPRQIEFWDEGLAPLKTLRVRELAEVAGIWTPLEVEVESRRTGHATTFRFQDVDYSADLSDSLFTERALARGAP